MEGFFSIIRPQQYIKNLFIFLPIFFVGEITDIQLFSKAFLAFIAFSLSASGIYILNDYKDIKEDRRHPKKKKRPLASGLISTNESMTFMSNKGGRRPKAAAPFIFHVRH